jgi:fructose-specific phosphotransferase system IIA component
MSNLGELMNTRGIVKLTAKDKNTAIEKLIDVLSKRREVGSKEKLRRAVKDREKILSTGIGGGIAVPHAKISQVKKFCAVVGISKTGLTFDSLDGKPVHVVFMIAAPENAHDEYLRILKQLAHTLKDESYKSRIVNAKDANAVIEIFSEIEY